MLQLWTAEFGMLEVWLLEFWRKLGLLLGWVRPPGEQETVVSEVPATGNLAGEPAIPVRTLEFDSVLPGMCGRVAVPAGPGRILMVSLQAVTVNDVFGALQYLAEAREQWPFGSDSEAFAGYITLEGPGWELTVFFRDAASRVEYYVARVNGGGRVSGEARWEVLAQALVLSPDYDAVVGYLARSPYWAAYCVV